MIGRFAIRAAIALFTGVVFLAVQSVFWSRAASVWMTVIIVAAMVISYFRPHNGILVVAGLAPLGGLWTSLVAPGVRGAEALVLAVLGGVLLRGWALHRFRVVRLDLMPISAVVFASLVAASCLVQVSMPGLDRRDLLKDVAQRYLTFPRDAAVFSTMLLLEGLALLVYTAHYCRTRPANVPRLIRMLVTSAVAAAIFNWWFFAHELIETGAPGAHFSDFLLTQRWSAHVGDPNAAGSFFAMAMITALATALVAQRGRVAWAGAGLVLGIALWMTASRTGITAVLLVGGFGVARLLVSRHATSVAKTATIGAVAIGALAIFSTQYILSRASVPEAVNIRWMFLQTTWRMLRAHPLFGVGIGQYPRWSGHFSSPELLFYYQRENAHNNFAQIAGELGLAGFAAFIAVLALSFSGVRRPANRHPAVMPVVAGVAAFVLSWLGSHPLLVPAVAYPFWIALGVVAGAASDIISPRND